MTEQDPSATLLFGGDFCPIGRYESRIIETGNPFDEDLANLFRQADFSMVNLEAPLCDPGLPSDSPDGHGLRADPRIATCFPGLGIDAVGLANNHIRDFLDEGVRQTIQHLDAAGVRHTGAGMNLDQAQQPLAVSVNGLDIGIWALAERELNVASPTRAGSSWFRPELDAATVAELRSRFDLLIVYLHAGHEFTSTPSPRIRWACRRLIDAGADAVVAHHPHVVQGMERYRDGLIAYSLGNLVFHSRYVSAYRHTDTGHLLRLEVSPHRIDRADVIPYRLHEGGVSLLTGTERDAFDRVFADLSANIVDEARFEQAWDASVRFRWGTAYREILRGFSERFCDPAHKDYARRARNLFNCPTHVEMIDHAITMLEQGKLPRPGLDDKPQPPEK